MAQTVAEILSFHRRDLPSMPSLKDIVPEPEMSIEDALRLIRRGRSALLTAGAQLSSAEITRLSRDINGAIEELDQVRRLLMADSERSAS